VKRETVTEGHFRKQVVQYDPEILLQMCNRTSVNLYKQGKSIVTATWPSRIGPFLRRQNVHITQHKLALLAMIVLQNYRWAHASQPSPEEFIILANNVSNIESPIEKHKLSSEEELTSTLVRLAYQQFPFQEEVYHTLPRHLLLYLDMHVAYPTIDPDVALLKKVGLSIKDFMTIGIAFHAASLEHSTFDRKFIENTPIASLQPYVKPEKVTAFLSVVAADFAAFRNLCLQEVQQFPKAGLYRFNPLFDRPIIICKGGLLCVPVPLLLLYVVTKGLYYDFLDGFSGDNGNPFSEWFGHAFEQYGGLLLRDAFGCGNVFEEPVYGKPQRAGPDWTVTQGNTAIIFEFRSGRLNKRAKTYGDYEEIVELLERNVLETLKKIPIKINALRSGATGISLSGVTEYIPCVVTYEPLYSHELFLDVITRELRNQNVPEFDFELMSIEDLEWLLAWAAYEEPVEFIQKKLANPEWKVMSTRRLIEEKATEKGVNELHNRLLEETINEYWGEIAPALFEVAED